MGNNQAGRDFQQMVIGLYDLGKLDIKALDLVGETFFYYPVIDSGGYDYGLVTKDDLTVEQVVLKILDPAFVPEDDDHFYDHFYELTRERWQGA